MAKVAGLDRLTALASDHQSPVLDVMVRAGNWPEERDLRGMARNAIGALVDVTRSKRLRDGEISLVFTNDAEISSLNAKWRGIDKSTNVLSFPQIGAGESASFDSDGQSDPQSGAMLGDVILASETIANEARLAHKPLNHHILHLITHGVLHLIGYDHLNDQDAERMEEVERRVLAQLEIPDPYVT